MAAQQKRTVARSMSCLWTWIKRYILHAGRELSSGFALPNQSFFPSRKSKKESSKDSERSREPQYLNEVYQAFMVGYVKRINDATLRVPIGGVRIGSAKYSRLAQINLKSHIITFSRYAIENVPERGRRYLVIHELAHVKEASHNKHFWNLVGEHEPSYKQVGQELDKAFHQNVRAEMRNSKSREGKGLAATQGRLFPNSLRDDSDYFESLREDADEQSDLHDEEFDFDDEYRRETSSLYDSHGNRMAPPGSQAGDLPVLSIANPGLKYPLDSGVVAANEYFDCNEGDFDSWQRLEQGIVFGGSNDEEMAGCNDDYFDHL